MDEYLSSRYIVAPMHLLDMCLVNDGAVCVIMRRTEMAGDGRTCRCWCPAGATTGIARRRCARWCKERLRYQLQEGVSQALAMAGMDLSEIGHLEVYDPSTIHLVNQIEGFGFVPTARGLNSSKQATSPSGDTPHQYQWWATLRSLHGRMEQSGRVREAAASPSRASSSRRAWSFTLRLHHHRCHLADHLQTR